MKMLGSFGRKHVAVLASFAPSMVAFGGAAFAGIVYATDWKVICANIPFYNTKFTKEELEAAASTE